MSLDLAGTFLPVCTPFDPVTGDVDVVAFRSNLRHWFRHPITGVVIAGTNGEGVLLDDGERAALVGAAADVTPDGALVLAWAGAESTRQAARSTCVAAEAGADAVQTAYTDRANVAAGKTNQYAGAQQAMDIARFQREQSKDQAGALGTIVSAIA